MCSRILKPLCYSVDCPLVSGSHDQVTKGKPQGHQSAALEFEEEEPNEEKEEETMELSVKKNPS